MPESLPHHRLPLGNHTGRHQARKQALCPESIPSTGRPDQPCDQRYVTRHGARFHPHSRIQPGSVESGCHARRRQERTSKSEASMTFLFAMLRIATACVETPEVSAGSVNFGRRSS